MPAIEDPGHGGLANHFDHGQDADSVGEFAGNGQLKKWGSKSVRWICERCSNLGLSVDRFLINGSHSAERSQYLSAGSASTPFSPKMANSRYPLGSYAEIVDRSSHCRFCELVVKSVRDPDDGNGSGDGDGDGNVNGDGEPAKSAEQRGATCFVTWEIDGRSAGGHSQPVKARTRRLHLQWQGGAFEDSYLVLVTQDQQKSINSDARNMWQADEHFLARKLSKDASRATLVKSWLDDCLKYHRGECLHSIKDLDAFQEVIDQSYFGVIDVEQMCLTRLPRTRTRVHVVERYKMEDGGDRASTSSSGDYLGDQPYGSSTDRTIRVESSERLHEPYVALSYVWGGNNAEKTVHDNVLMRLLNGGLEEPLKRMPKVIKDTVELVRRLGYRYLWIDAICIVQDSSRSWRLNAEVMDMIYGNAELTVCAADGVDATAGLRALSRPAYDQAIVECVPGLRLMVSRLAEASINKSRWNTRGWTFQERLLSRRCLIFTEGRVMFQCRSAAMSEDIVTASVPSYAGAANARARPRWEKADVDGPKWSLDLLRSPLKLLGSLATRPAE